MGRTRQDAPLPTIGNMSPADAPHLVFLQDPVAQDSYTLNLTDKTAMKGPSVSGMAAPELRQFSDHGTFGAEVTIRRRIVGAGPAPQMVAIQKRPRRRGAGANRGFGIEGHGRRDVTGTRTTRTIPAGQIGNDKPMSIVTEVWTSPELKTVVYSKRSDPRMGDQTFKLTNIVRRNPIRRSSQFLRISRWWTPRSRSCTRRPAASAVAPDQPAAKTSCANKRRWAIRAKRDSTRPRK